MARQMSDLSPQAAHDALLAAMPEGASHAPCELCPSEITTQAKETVVPEKRTFTEEEHFALVADAVSREVASATDALSQENTDLKARVDVLEAEKAAEVEAKNAIQAEFDQFKADLETAREVEARKESRKAAVKEVAGSLSDDYFTDERVQRWAEMADEAFADLLDDLVDTQIAQLAPEVVAEFAGLVGEDKRTKLAEVRSRAKAETPDTPAPAVETAAFTGGVTPTSPETKGSTLGQLLRASGHAVPAPTA